MATTSVIIFWSCATVFIYTYLVYPPLIWCLSRVFGCMASAREIDDSNAPNVSLLIAAHNEEAVIDQRLNNALALDYPHDRLEIVVVSDGSSDQTTNIVNSYADRGVRLIEFAEQRGKAAVLGRAIAQLQSEIVVLSDANTDLDISAVKKLVRWFDDSTVGVVCGRLILIDPLSGHNADSFYWKYETMLKQSEARLGALLGANGAIYAIRRWLFVSPPDGTLVDDLVIPLLAKLRHGCSILYDAQAIAREETAMDVREEFRRRVRIGAGNFQSIGLLWPLLNPRRGFIAFSFFSHKLLRWFCPFFLIGLLASSIALADRPFYRIILLAQLAMYAIAAAAMIAPRKLGLPKLIRLAVLFVNMNIALLAGFCRWCFPSGQNTWKPTARSSLLEKKSG
ncbi:MAG TPA: glycosyltransferase family 2 protein [Tepidisphaeraceae bacterium]|nr:glycosyltransferase family 2 protein [Tepidisphaeraceae bacterium]